MRAAPMTASSDIPLQVQDRPTFQPLSDDANDAFLRQQAEYEAAWRRTKDPEVLWFALLHVSWARQTIPGWLWPEIGVVLLRKRSPAEIRRFRERMRKVRRFILVRNRRAKGLSKEKALNKAEALVQGDPGSQTWETIEQDYVEVKKD